MPQTGIELLPLRLKTPDSYLALPQVALDMILGIGRSLKEFRSFQPRTLFSTGGFVSIPATVAAWLTRTPIVLYLPDVRPGRAVRLSAKLATQIAVSTQESLQYLPNSQTTVTGYPVRSSFQMVSREQARTEMGLTSADLQVLVMGGSLGSRTINRAIGRGLPDLLASARVLHVCGQSHLDQMKAARDSLSLELRRRYDVVPYLAAPDMVRAMAASDLAITRGGASILGELPAARLPAIVVPLPASHVGQEANAHALASHGACVLMSDGQAESGRLVELALQLLEDSARRESMAQALAGLARPEASRHIANLILSQAGHAA